MNSVELVGEGVPLRKATRPSADSGRRRRSSKDRLGLSAHLRIGHEEHGLFDLSPAQRMRVATQQVIGQIRLASIGHQVFELVNAPCLNRKGQNAFTTVTYRDGRGRLDGRYEHGRRSGWHTHRSDPSVFVMHFVELDLGALLAFRVVTEVSGRMIKSDAAEMYAQFRRRCARRDLDFRFG